MTLPIYQIVIMEPIEGKVVHVMSASEAVELKYSRKINDVGALAMTIIGDLDFFDTIGIDYFVEIQRQDPKSTSPRVEETYFIRSRQKYSTPEEQGVVIGGVSLNDLLLRRVINPDDDPLEAGGYTTKGGPSDELIRDYVREQAADLASADRLFPGFTVPEVPNVGINSGRRLRFEGLLETVQDIAKNADIDFRVHRTVGSFMELFIGTIGQDRTRQGMVVGRRWMGLDPDRGNLTDPVYIEDRTEEKNFVYTLGEGQGETRIVLPIPGRGISDSPFNRREFVHDARNVEKGDAVSLLAEGRAELLRQAEGLNEFTFSPTGSEPGNVYGQDWDLGDKVTLRWGQIEEDIRIVEIEVSIGSEGEKISVGVQNIT